MKRLLSLYALLISATIHAQTAGDYATWRKAAGSGDTKTYTSPINNGLFSTNGSGSFALIAKSTFQDALVSGTNIKTINGNSLLGSSDLVLIVDAINNGIVGSAPSQNAVFDALALKADATHVHAASDITSGTIATARLGSGTANSTTFLRGDNTWQTISSGSGDVVGPASSTDNNVPQWDGTTGKLLKNGLGISTGGNGAADGGKLVRFRADGDIYFSNAGSGSPSISALSTGTGDGVSANADSGDALSATSNTGKALHALASGADPAIHANGQGAGIALEVEQNGVGGTDLALFHDGTGDGLEVKSDGGLEWTSATGAQTTADNLPVVQDGDVLTTGLTFPDDGIKIRDADLSNELTIALQGDLTTDRNLFIGIDDADRSFSLNADLTVSGDADIQGTNTGDQTITLTGPVTGSGTGSFATTITNGAVTFNKLPLASSGVVIGNPTAFSTGSFHEMPCTDFGFSLIDDANASAARTTLGLVIGTNVQAFDSDLSTWAGITPASGMGSWIATPSSANLRSTLTDELGTGAALFDGATPTSLVGTNITGTAAGLTAGTVTTNANLTGVVTSTGNATAIADGALSIAKTNNLQTTIDAKVADAINDGTTTIAPSQNAVFDALALKAPLASPTFTGTPAAPTAAAGTNTTQLATTAFVQAYIATLAPSFLTYSGGSQAYAVTTLAAVNSTTFTFPSTGFYHVQYSITHDANATTTGANFNVAGTAAFDYLNIVVVYRTDNATTGRSAFSQNAFGSAGGAGLPTTSSNATTNNRVAVDVWINVTTVGDISLLAASEVAVASGITVTDVDGFMKKEY